MRRPVLFRVVPVLSVLVISALIVVGILHPHQTHNLPGVKNVAATSPSQTPATQQQTGAPQQAPATANLTIKEWNVTSPNNSSDSFTYNMSPDMKSLSVVSKKLASEDVQCAKRGAGVVLRFAPTDYVSPYGTGPTVQQYTQQNPGTYAYVGGYYYLFQPSQAACGSVSANDQAEANNDVKTMLAHLQVGSN